MTEGLMLFAESNTWTQYIGRTKRYYLHGLLLFLSLICVSVGNIIIVQKKDKKSCPNHYGSSHGITGKQNKN